MPEKDFDCRSIFWNQKRDDTKKFVFLLRRPNKRETKLCFFFGGEQTSARGIRGFASSKQAEETKACRKKRQEGRMRLTIWCDGWGSVEWREQVPRGGSLWRRRKKEQQKRDRKRSKFKHKWVQNRNTTNVGLVISDISIFGQINSRLMVEINSNWKQ